MRAVFFGTPEIAVPALQALAEVSKLVGVICQPDRPSGRGLKVTEPAVKKAAIALGIQVYQPTRVRDGSLARWLRDREADLGVVLAYGRILPPPVLATPRLGCVNLHASLLPKYRGAAPINWCIIRGEAATGVSLMRMEESLDSGPVYTKRSVAIGQTESAGELSVRLAQVAADMVRSDIPNLAAGELEATPQDHSLVTWAPPIKPAHRQIDWSQHASAVLNHFRGLAPRPGVHTLLHGRRLRITGLAPLDAYPPAATAVPGQLEVCSSRVLVACGEGWLELLSAQQEGRRQLCARDLVNGRVLATGMRLGE